MDVQVINFRPYAKGYLVGFFALAVSGLVVTGCKAFQKSSQLWFAWPAEKLEGRNGEAEYRDIVTAAGPMMEHLQQAVRAQLRPLLEGSRPAAEDHRQQQRQFKTPEGEDLSEYRALPCDSDIPF